FYYEKSYNVNDANSEVKKEIEKQLPDGTSETTIRKRKERAQKIFHLFSKIGIDKIVRNHLYKSRGHDLEGHTHMTIAPYIKFDGDGSDRRVAKSWNNERSRNRIYIQQPTITGENINGNGTFVSGSSISKRDHEEDEHKDRTKKMKTIDSKIDEFFSPVKTHENVNNDHDNEVVALEPRCHLPEEELEDGLLQESPNAIVDYKLMINNVCIRSVIEKWRESSKYVEEIHKQDLMRYNIIETTRSSATEARKLLKDYWEDIISTIEKFLMSRPDATPVDSDSDSASASTDQTMEQDGRAEDIRQYLTKISKNMNTAKRLCDVIMAEREKLRADGNIKWKKRSLELMKIFSQMAEITSKKIKPNMTTLLGLSLAGEKTLRCSAILLNQSMKDDNRRCSGNKIDAIMSILDLDLEFSTLEVSGSPSSLDHTHYVGDRNKTAKMLKIILNYIFIKYPGDFEKFRRIKVYGVQIYVANFRFKLVDVAVTSSSESILAYITSVPSEIGNDNAMIANVEVSPKKKKN
ncbi:41771_t:CDS:10, partial [Gigaspora margarita]